MRATLVQRVLHSINIQKIFKSGDRVCVAVSGGADSVALLLLLSELRGKLGMVLSVAHFNHKLRGKASDADEAFVRKLAKRLELPFHSDRADVAAQAKRERANLEDTARRAGYSFFARLVSCGHATRIAVAHTADDQAETVLAHILRGTGLAGLGGIMPVSGHIFRPLLQFRREELRAYLRARKQTWREDATNRDTTRMRARIRKILLPLLEKKFQPAVVEHLSTLASIARDDEDCLKRIAERFVVSCAEIAKGTAKIAIADLLSPLEENLFAHTAHTEEPNQAEQNSAEALRKRIVRQLIAAVKPRPGQLTAAHTAKILDFARSGENGKLLQLPGGVEVRRERDSLVIRANAESSAKFAAAGGSQTTNLDFSHKIDLSSGETRVRIPELGYSFRFTMIDWPSKRRETIGAGALLDRDRLREPFVLRNRQGGDALRLTTFGNGRKLKRLLNDIHVSRWERQVWT